MAKAKKYKYIYGPVNSWRLGSSLGIDSISSKRKICTFNCTYCQLGSAKPVSGKRKIFIPAEKIIKEIEALPPLKIDYITFSGTGEPTLAKNLIQLINGIKKRRREKIAVLTNASLINKKEVHRALSLADLVAVKLDASFQALFEKVNRPVHGLKLKNIIKGIKDFKARYKGKLALQVMFTRENKPYAEEIAKIAKDTAADEVQINTPLRPCGAKPLSKKEMDLIKLYFKGMDIISVYDIMKKKKVMPISKKDTLKRRGKI